MLDCIYWYSNALYFKQMRKILITVFILVTIHGIGQHLYEPSARFWKNWYVMPQVGIVQFYGDVNEKTFKDKIYNQTTMGLALAGGKQFNRWLGIRGWMNYSKLRSLKQGEMFSSEVCFGANMGLTVDFLTLIEGRLPEIKNHRFTVFILTGIGFMNWRVRYYDEGKVVGGNGNKGNGLFSLTTEASIPLGLGIATVGKRLGFDAEVLWYLINTDKLDGKPAGTRRDLMFFPAVGLAYKFNFSNKEKPIPKLEPFPEEVKWETPDLRNPDIQKVRLAKMPEPVLGERAEIKKLYAIFVGFSEKRLSVKFFQLKYPELPDYFKDKFYEEKTDGGYRYMIGFFRDYIPAYLIKNELIRYGLVGADVIVVLNK